MDPPVRSLPSENPDDQKLCYRNKRIVVIPLSPTGSPISYYPNLPPASSQNLNMVRQEDTLLALVYAAPAAAAAADDNDTKVRPTVVSKVS